MRRSVLSVVLAGVALTGCSNFRDLFSAHSDVAAEAGADAVKLEGGRPIVPTLQAVHNAGVPVIGHIGLTPQNAAQLGGLKVQGGDAVGGKRLLEDALALEAAGAFAVILECVPREVARIITQIRKQKIPAVFLENVTDDRLLKRIGAESGARIGGTLYSDALTDAKGPAPTYIDMMRHNVKQLVEALIS